MNTHMQTKLGSKKARFLYVAGLLLTVALIMHSIGLLNPLYVNAQSVVRTGKLIWSGVWGSNNFSCEPGYTIVSYHYDCGCSNNATWFACVK